MLRKLIKYEFRKGIGPYLIILSAIIVGLVLTGIQTSFIDFGSNYSENKNSVMIAGLVLTIGLTYALIIAGAVFNFVQGIMYLADEYFRDKGYLTFSTSNSSYKIIASKLLTYLIRNFIYFTVIGLLILVIFFLNFGKNNIVMNGFGEIIKYWWVIILVIVYIFMSQLIHMVFIYLIMTLNVTVFDFKHKILSSFLMYFGVTICLRILLFFLQIYLDFSSNTFLSSMTYNTTYYQPAYEHLIVALLITLFFIIVFGVFFTIYFVTCKLINKGIDI